MTLPHDAMIGQERVAPDSETLMGGGAGAYFPGGAFEYRKIFSVPEEHRGRRILLEFEGVYRDAMVYINGDYAGQRPYGYSLFRIDADRFLRFGADNEIRVEARAHRDSRWYTGAGIYRDTWLLTGGLVRIGPDGVRVTTPDIDGETGGRRGRDHGRERLDRDQDGRHPHRDPRRRRERRRGRYPPVSVLPGEPGDRAAAAVRPRPGAMEPGFARPVHGPGDG